MEKRGSFGSRLGVVLATAGSAIGLGNIWRFPYLTGENGGAAFILLYLVCVYMLGIPGMVAEFVVGRRSASNAGRAYRSLSRGGGWGLIGYVGMLTSLIILGFYSVIAGWCLQYLYASIMGELNGDSQFVAHYFQSFSSGVVKPIFWGVGFVLLTHFVVVKGVRNGIERFSKILMPLLLLLLVIIVVASCSLPGAMAGVEFLFKPDFSKLTSHVFLDALGQAFFSLSLGTACLCTYASYFSRQTHLVKSATQIALLDTMVAILAGLMIFPAAFAVGVNPDSGPSLIFITLPNVFQQAFASMPIVGYMIAILFYALLVLAALTSTISMHEIGTAVFSEEMHLTRKQGAWIETVAACLIAVVCSLSCGAVPGLELFGKSVLDFCDFLTGQILLPLGALFTCLFVGWYLPRKLVHEEFTNWGTLRGRFYGVFIFMVRFVCPLCIASIFLHQFGVI